MLCAVSASSQLPLAGQLLFKVMTAAISSNPCDTLQVMIAVDEALRRLEISAPERNAILEAFRYADTRNAAALASAVQAAQQEAAHAAQEAEGAHSQQSPPLLSSKPFTRCVFHASTYPCLCFCLSPNRNAGGMFQ